MRSRHPRVVNESSNSRMGCVVQLTTRRKHASAKGDKSVTVREPLPIRQNRFKLRSMPIALADHEPTKALSMTLLRYLLVVTAKGRRENEPLNHKSEAAGFGLNAWAALEPIRFIYARPCATHPVGLVVSSLLRCTDDFVAIFECLPTVCTCLHVFGLSARFLDLVWSFVGHFAGSTGELGGFTVS